MSSLAPEPLAKLGSVQAFAGDLRRFAGNRGNSAVLLVAMSSLLEGVGLLLLLPLLTVVLGSTGGTGIVSRATSIVLWALPAKSVVGRLSLLLLGFGALVALRGIVFIKRDILLTRLQAEFVNATRLRIVELLSRSQWSTISRLKHGRIAYILGQDVYNIRSVAHFLVQTAVAIVMIIGQTLLALMISPFLAVVILILLGLIFAFTRPLLARARRFGSDLAESNQILASSTTEFLSGLKVSISQNLQQAFLDGFHSGSSVAAEREVAFAKQRAVAQAALTGFAAAAGSCVLLVAVPWLRSPTPSLIALVAVMARMMGPAMQVQQGMQQVVHGLPAYLHLKRLEAELERGADSISGPRAGSRRLNKPQPISFRKVSFSHQGEDAGIVDLNLEIPPGSILGVTGASGAGKTTFADLLVGLFSPQTGLVLAAGKALEGAHLHAWRDSISYVSQDPFLHHATVRENLLWADPRATEDELWNALHIADADELLRRLPEGLETVVGERGCLLSGGERQRVALARALIRKPVLLLLDEATNAIDIASERLILERLSRMRPRPTIVMIAHQESSLAFCDRIIVLVQGRLHTREERLPIVS